MKPTRPFGDAVPFGAGGARPRRWSHAGGMLAVGYLAGSLVLTFPAMLVASGLSPGLPERFGRWFFFGTMAVLCSLGGLLWARRVAKSVGVRRRRSWAFAGAIAYGACAPMAVFALTEAETLLLRRAMEGVEYPMHIAFAVLFSCAVFGVVALTALALGLAASRGREAVGIAASSAAVATMTFLLVNLAFDLAGWRVGAPGAEERFTMVLVLAVGLLVSTFVSGATLTGLLAAGSGDRNGRPGGLYPSPAGIGARSRGRTHAVGSALQEAQRWGLAALPAHAPADGGESHEEPRGFRRSGAEIQVDERA